MPGTVALSAWEVDASAVLGMVALLALGPTQEIGASAVFGTVAHLLQNSFREDPP